MSFIHLKEIKLMTPKRGYPFRGNPFGEKDILEATFKDEDNNLIDPDCPPTVRIEDPSGRLLVSDEGAKQRSKGNWYFEFLMPDNMMVGKWMDIWKVTINGEVFEESRKILVCIRPKPTGQTIRYGVFRKKKTSK